MSPRLGTIRRMHLTIGGILAWTAINAIATLGLVAVTVWLTVTGRRRDEQRRSQDRENDSQRRAEDRQHDEQRRAEDRQRDDRLRQEAREEAQRREDAEQTAQQDRDARQVIVRLIAAGLGNRA
jgi:membrane protein involved in colicin uptake